MSRYVENQKEIEKVYISYLKGLRKWALFALARTSFCHFARPKIAKTGQLETHVCKTRCFRVGVAVADRF